MCDGLILFCNMCDSKVMTLFSLSLCLQSDRGKDMCDEGFVLITKYIRYSLDLIKICYILDWAARDSNPELTG